jgi:hypothetical protein
MPTAFEHRKGLGVTLFVGPGVIPAQARVGP